MATALQVDKRTGPLARMQQYVDGVLSGEIVVGNLVRLAVERHVRDVETGPDRGLWFDAEEAGFTEPVCRGVDNGRRPPRSASGVEEVLISGTSNPADSPYPRAARS